MTLSMTALSIMTHYDTPHLDSKLKDIKHYETKKKDTKQNDNWH